MRWQEELGDLRCAGNKRTALGEYLFHRSPFDTMLKGYFMEGDIINKNYLGKKKFQKI